MACNQFLNNICKISELLTNGNLTFSKNYDFINSLLTILDGIILAVTMQYNHVVC